MAADHGEAIGVYATALLDTPSPSTKMRQVYRPLRMVKKWGAAPVELACRRAHEAVDVNFVSRMPERAGETPSPTTDPSPSSSAGWLATHRRSPLRRRRADDHARASVAPDLKAPW
jgi:hypothetical protein